MKVDASLWVASLWVVTKSTFDVFGELWADVNIHSSLYKEFVHSIRFSSYFKTIIALSVGASFGIIREDLLEEVR